MTSEIYIKWRRENCHCNLLKLKEILVDFFAEKTEVLLAKRTAFFG